MIRVHIVAFALSAVLTAARADSYVPFVNFRQVESTGRHYIVVKKLPDSPPGEWRGTSVEFTLAQCKPGAPPIRYVEDHRFGDRQVKPNPDVKVRDGDRVLGRGKLERSPRRYLISSTGLGLVGLDVRGDNYRGRQREIAVVVVAPDGSIRHRKHLSDLFTEEEIEDFMHTFGSICWLHDGWIDEKRREAVIIGSNDSGEEKRVKPRQIRVVSMETGKVRKGSLDDVVTALAERNRGGLDAALELAAEQKIEKAKPYLSKHLDDGALPLETRLRTAVALAILGDKRGADLMTKAALEKGPAQEYAVELLPEVLGGAAGAILCEAVLKHGEDVQLAAWSSMQRVSASATVPPLLKLLNDRKNVNGVDFAAECLGFSHDTAKAAMPDLIRILRERPQTKRPEWTIRMAVSALGKVGPEAKEVVPLLLEIGKASRARAERLKAEGYRRPEKLMDDEWWSAKSLAEVVDEAVEAIVGPQSKSPNSKT